MAGRPTLLSFHFARDVHRVQQIRNIGDAMGRIWPEDIEDRAAS
jgi:hypothetical protein